MENIEQQKPQSHFVDASITVGDHVYELSVEQAGALQNGAYYWHGAGDPSSWLAVAIFLEARRRGAAVRREMEPRSSSPRCRLVLESCLGFLTVSTNCSIEFRRHAELVEA